MKLPSCQLIFLWLLCQEDVCLVRGQFTDSFSSGSGSGDSIEGSGSEVKIPGVERHFCQTPYLTGWKVLQCDTKTKDVIFVINASVGNESSCESLDGSCNQDITEYVGDRCNGRQRCQIKTNESLATPCSTHHTYLRVHYDCIPKNNKRRLCNYFQLTTNRSVFLKTKGYPNKYFTGSDASCSVCNCWVWTRDNDVYIETTVLDFDLYQESHGQQGESQGSCDDHLKWSSVTWSNSTAKMTRECGRLHTYMPLNFLSNYLSFHLNVTGSKRSKNRGIWLALQLITWGNKVNKTMEVECWKAEPCSASTANEPTTPRYSSMWTHPSTRSTKSTPSNTPPSTYGTRPTHLWAEWTHPTKSNPASMPTWTAWTQSTKTTDRLKTSPATRSSTVKTSMTTRSRMTTHQQLWTKQTPPTDQSQTLLPVLTSKAPPTLPTTPKNDASKSGGTAMENVAVIAGATAGGAVVLLVVVAVIIVCCTRSSHRHLPKSQVRSPPNLSQHQTMYDSTNYSQGLHNDNPAYDNIYETIPYDTVSERDQNAYLELDQASCGGYYTTPGQQFEQQRAPENKYAVLETKSPEGVYTALNTNQSQK